MAVGCRNNYYYSLCQGWKGKESINILTWGKKVYCVKPRIFWSLFQNRVRHWEVNLYFKPIEHFNYAKLYTPRSLFFAYDQCIFWVWSCSENYFLNVTSNTMREKMYGICSSHRTDDGILDSIPYFFTS